MSEPEVIDAQPLEVDPPAELVLRNDESVELFGTSDPVEVIEKATRVADALKRVVDKQGLIARIQGKEHPLVEAWQTLGMMLGVTAVPVKTYEITDRHGKPGYKAEVEARWHGEVIGAGAAICSTSEKRWARADDYAILSMAQTRATSKALSGPLRWVMKLAGYEPTPAEEMPGDAAEPVNGAITIAEAQALVQRARDVGMKFGEVRRALEKAGVENASTMKDRDLLAAFEHLTPAQAATVDVECGRIADGEGL